MEDIKGRLDTMLEELRDTILELINTNDIDNAKILMGQYIKLSQDNKKR